MWPILKRAGRLCVVVMKYLSSGYHCYCITGWRQLLWGMGARPNLESCILEHYFWVALLWRLSRKHRWTPRRGIEPRSSAWQAEILATILTRTASLLNSAMSKESGRCSDFYYIVLFLLGHDDKSFVLLAFNSSKLDFEKDWGLTLATLCSLNLQRFHICSEYTTLGMNADPNWAFYSLNGMGWARSSTWPLSQAMSSSFLFVIITYDLDR